MLWKACITIFRIQEIQSGVYPLYFFCQKSAWCVCRDRKNSNSADYALAIIIKIFFLIRARVRTKIGHKYDRRINSLINAMFVFVRFRNNRAQKLSYTARNRTYLYRNEFNPPYVASQEPLKPTADPGEQNPGGAIGIAILATVNIHHTERRMVCMKNFGRCLSRWQWGYS